MKAIAIVTLVGGIVAGGWASAQDSSTKSSPNPPAVSTGDTDSKTSAAPVPGKNSFTESEARKRLRDHGYSNVQHLAQDDQGVWRGTASKAGNPVRVAVDYQGNITEE